MFKPVSSKVNFTELEEGILAFWKERNIFDKSVEQRRGSPLYVMYEGPPTANASPGVHHVLSRIFKDIIPRYWTMKGYCVPRKGGWDTHGLPVELEVERELGITDKSQIEDYGVDRFNQKCCQSVFRYVKEWEAMTDRIGFWIDMADPYVTFHNSYIESCWWILKQLWDRGLIYQGYKVTPHCPRCGTSLSSHEVALGYEENTPDPSIYVKFKLTLDRGTGNLPPDSPLRSTDVSTYFLAWTTTPWTLPSNLALAVADDANYALIEYQSGQGKERLILAEALLNMAILDNYQIVTSMPGSELLGLHYEPLYDLVPLDKPAHRIIAGDFVSMEDGTGIVHIAPAYGEVDLEVGKEEGLPVLHTVDLKGYIIDVPATFANKFVKDADPLIIEDLQSRGLMYRSEEIRHTYPFCWRCDTPLLYYAKTSWYIKTTAVKDRLISGNEEINWYPDYIKHGRFGDWLENNVDWAFSRERYWGTPLNVWKCQSCGEHECVGSMAELRDKPGASGIGDDFDLHRPFVDRVTFDCSTCGTLHSMHRVTEVLDAWFDSGAMPVAQWHYPFENEASFQQNFPADFICEAVDQTRGWFYTLHAISTLLFGRPCFKNVICLGLILDAEGEKMSKSKGNVVDPWTVLNVHGADALRWYLYTTSPPGNARRFSADLVGEALRKFLLTLWNTYSFFITYANIDKFDPRQALNIDRQSELDKWIISELNQLIEGVSGSLEEYHPTEAGRKIHDFVEEVSNWYVRRSRRRFWKSENDADKLAAYATLYECLVTLSKLMAPFTPFVTEAIYQNLVCSIYPEAPQSVHLVDFPQADASKVDAKLAADTQLAVKVSSLGRAARSKAGIKVRQPLAKVLVRARTKWEREGLERIAHQIGDELNVKQVEVFEDEQSVLQMEVVPNLSLLGPRFGKETSKIVNALMAADASDIASRAAAGREISVAGVTVMPNEFSISTSDKLGFVTAAEGGYLVAIMTQISPELADEGIARELVHRLQTMRRSAGLDIADYIETYYQAGESIQRVMENFAEYIKQETLSRRLVSAEPEEGAYCETHKINGNEVLLAVYKPS